MTTLTKKTKLKIWREVRRNVKTILAGDPDLAHNGLCHLLIRAKKLVTKSQYTGLASRIMHDVFQEGMKYKPTDARANWYWWPRTTEGYKARLKVCNDIIRKLEYKK